MKMWHHTCRLKNRSAVINHPFQIVGCLLAVGDLYEKTGRAEWSALLSFEKAVRRVDLTVADQATGNDGIHGIVIVREELAFFREEHGGHMRVQESRLPATHRKVLIHDEVGKILV